MPSETEVILTRDASLALCEIPSKKLRSSVWNRIVSLGTFPRIGPSDPMAPSSSSDVERRITFVAPFAIRYTYLVHEGIVRIDAITDERRSSLNRFL